MEARAIARHVRVSPRKARMVADYIRGKKVNDATQILSMVMKKSAEPIHKTIESAVANVLNNVKGGSHIDVDDLYVHQVYIDGGPIMKRFRARAMGRAARIRKRTCHITVVVKKLES